MAPRFSTFLVRVWHTYYDSNSGIGTIFIEGGAGANVESLIVPPIDPDLGDLWFHSEVGRTFIYYDETKLGTGTDSSGLMLHQSIVLYSLDLLSVLDLELNFIVLVMLRLQVLLLPLSLMLYLILTLRRIFKSLIMHSIR